MLLKNSGMKAKKPRDIMRKPTTDIILIYGRFLSLLHKNKLINGERNKVVEGKPIIRCNFKGNGNMPAPAIDMVYYKIIIAGITLNPDSLQTLYNPITNTTLSAEHNTRPAENT
jgi:hypothetical protein